MDEDELKQESKLGLKKQEVKKAPVQEPGDIPLDDLGRYDFLRMNQTGMSKCLPINTEVYFYISIKILSVKRLMNMFSLMFQLP